MPNRSFHNLLPEWAYASLSKRTCSQCSSKYSRADIIAVGIRKLEDPDHAMYLEHQCSSCGFRALTTLGKQKENSLEKLCYVILESIKKRKLIEKSKLINKHTKMTDPMSDGEVSRIIDFMNDNKSHEDFMREIGVVLPENKEDDSS